MFEGRWEAEQKVYRAQTLAKADPSPGLAKCLKLDNIVSES